jgi:chemotaxis response regulator CheB
MRDIMKISDAGLSLIGARSARIFSEIEKTHPDVVVMDLDLYEKIDGIETSRRIRSQFGVPVMYV